MSQRGRMSWWPFLPLIVFIGIVGSATSAYAATLHVANNAVDSDTCGSLAQPCRSINKAISRAHDGDQIVVGPGSYLATQESSWPPGLAPA